MPRLLNAKGSGPWANHSSPLDLVALARVGLLVVRDYDSEGKLCAETVVPREDVPASWIAPQDKPTRPCGACHVDAWRPDRGTGLSFICGRCHP